MEVLSQGFFYLGSSSTGRSVKPLSNLVSGTINLVPIEALGLGAAY
ncbi:MAG: hypothetical protein V3U26_07595 [Dehalococcoidia bacterium]